MVNTGYHGQWERKEEIKVSRMKLKQMQSGIKPWSEQSSIKRWSEEQVTTSIARNNAYRSQQNCQLRTGSVHHSHNSATFAPVIIISLTQHLRIPAPPQHPPWEPLLRYNWWCTGRWGANCRQKGSRTKKGDTHIISLGQVLWQCKCHIECSSFSHQWLCFARGAPCWNMKSNDSLH